MAWLGLPLCMRLVMPFLTAFRCMPMSCRCERCYIRKCMHLRQACAGHGGQQRRQLYKTLSPPSMTGASCILVGSHTICGSVRTARRCSSTPDACPRILLPQSTDKHDMCVAGCPRHLILPVERSHLRLS